MPDESTLTASYLAVLNVFRQLEAEGLPPHADAIRARLDRPIGPRGIKNIVSRLRLLGHLEAGRQPRRFAKAPSAEEKPARQRVRRTEPVIAPAEGTARRPRPHSDRCGSFADEVRAIRRVMRWARTVGRAS
jgi:hypothetical protein